MTRLEARVKKAKAAAKFSAVMTRGKKDGLVRTIVVPGSQGKQYHIILRRYKTRAGKVFKITTECRVIAGNNGHVTCPGNSNGCVCYHSMAAILTMANGYNVSFCSSREDANRLSHINNGRVGILASHQGKGRLFTVISRSRKGKGKCLRSIVLKM